MMDKIPRWEGNSENKPGLQSLLSLSTLVLRKDVIIHHLAEIGSSVNYLVLNEFLI